MEQLNTPEDDEDEWAEEGSTNDGSQDFTDERGEYPQWNCPEPRALSQDSPEPFADSDQSLTNNTTQDTTINTHIKGYTPQKTPEPASFSSLGSTLRHKPTPPTKAWVSSLGDRDRYQVILAKLSEITGFDPQLKAVQPRMHKAATQLVRGSYTTDMLEMLFQDWKEKGWRWLKNRQLPTPEQVLQGIGLYKHPAKRYAGKWLGEE